MMKKYWKLVTACAILATPGIATAQGVVYAYDLRFAASTNLFSFPVNDPLTQTQIGSVGVQNYTTFAMDFDTAGNNLYAVDHLFGAGSLQLGVIDITTGVFTAGPLITGGGYDTDGQNPTGLSVDPVTETFYSSKSDRLFTIDPVTGQATLIGPFLNVATGTSPGLVIDIAINNNGEMFAHVLSTVAPGGTLWFVDKSTGSLQLIGASGIITNFAQGMDFDPTTNLLYAALYTSGGNGSYGIWNTTDGSWTEILPLQNFPDPSSNGRELEMAIRGPGGPAECLGDIADDFGFTVNDGGGPDGVVDFGDFVALLGLIGPCPGGTPGCLGDIADDFGFTVNDGGGPDGQVDFGDFVALLGLIGPCP